MHVVEHCPCASGGNWIEVIPVDFIIFGQVSAAQVALEVVLLLGPGCPLARPCSIGRQVAFLRAATLLATPLHRAALRGAGVGGNAGPLAGLAVLLASVCVARIAVEEPTAQAHIAVRAILQ